MRVYDNGSFFSVSLNENEIAAFRRRWPASGLGSLRSAWFQFEKRNGDLVDMKCNGRSVCEAFNGSALSALSSDAQCAGAKKLGLDPSTHHCGSSDPKTREAWGVGRLAGVGLRGIKTILTCDMDATCTDPVTHIEDKGYVYCSRHAIERRSWGHRCRKLRPSEHKKLLQRETIRY